MRWPSKYYYRPPLSSPVVMTHDKWLRSLSTGRQEPCSLFVILCPPLLHHQKAQYQARPFSPTGMCFPPSNLPLIISVASPTSSHPFLSPYWHCHRHRPWLSHPSLTPSLPSSLNPSHHSHSALPQEHLSLSLSPHPPHCLPTHPLSVGVSGHPAGRFITATSQQQQHCQARARAAHTHTHTHTHTYAGRQTNARTCRHTHAHDLKQIQSNNRKTKPRQAFHNERDGKGLAGYNLLWSHLIVISDH